MLNQQTQSLDQAIVGFVERIQRRNRRETAIAWVLIAIFAAVIAFAFESCQADRAGTRSLV